MDFEAITNKFLEMVIFYGPKLIVAVLTLVIGLWIINVLLKVMFKRLSKSGQDITLINFIKSIAGIALKIMLWITVISMLGVKMTSFIAVLGAAGLAVGLALQGSLANFAGGVLIMLFRPFKVGDFISAQGHMGTVNSIQIFNTILKTVDNKTIIIPNGNLANSDMINFSTESTRRVDLSFGISYEDDFQKAKKIINELIEKDERIFKDPPPFVRVGELADSSVNITVRIWANAADYWGIHFDLIENVKSEFDKQKISIPFPQSDVHLYNHSK
ncbi:MAG: mechanosensitive ion channel protein MscS [Candidatus Cloacimonas sp. SDB]|nr:MAG: mechanosensitive ion channel protein MscS [Candidatus Cloacimonas sp. SDB]